MGLKRKLRKLGKGIFVVGFSTLALNLVGNLGGALYYDYTLKWKLSHGKLENTMKSYDDKADKCIERALIYGYFKD